MSDFIELDDVMSNSELQEQKISETNIEEVANTTSKEKEKSEEEAQLVASEKKKFNAASGKPKNKAPMLNRGLILGIVLSVLVIMVSFIFLAGGKKQKEKRSEDIAKASDVYVPNFDAMAEDGLASAIASEDVPDINTDTAFQEEPISMEDIDAKIAAMNENQVGTAPVYQEQNQNYVGGGGGGKRRPDTRDNQMQKNISGIKGLTKVESQNQNTHQMQQSGINMNQMQNAYSYFENAHGNGNSVQDLMSRQGLAGAFLNNNKNQTEINQAFFEKNFGGNNQGQFLQSLSLWQGTYIPALLVSGLDTSLPGNVVARVTQNVYSSDGMFLLIPQGTLLFAEYNSSVGYGQNRIQIGWTALIRPDGFYIQLANMPAVDPQGFSGIKGRTNLHFWEYIKGLFLVSAISVLDTDINQTANQFTDPYSQGVIDRLRPGYQSIQDKIINQALNIPPSLRIKAGSEINILVNQTLFLPPVPMAPVTQKYTRRR